MKSLILISIIWLCLINSFISIGQKGYLKKKNYISISVLGNVPLLSGAFSQPNYYDDNGVIKERKDWLDYGGSFEYSYVANKRVRVGFEMNYKRFEVATNSRFESSFAGNLIGRYTQTTSIQSAQVALNSFGVMPVFYISPRNGIAGSGIYHKIGAGVNFTSIHNTDYSYALNEFYFDDNTNANWAQSDTYGLKSEWNSYKAIVFTYELGLSVPITDNVHFATGFEYFINIYFKPSENEFLENNEAFFRYDDIFYNVQRENLFTWNLKVGLTFAL